MRKIDEKSETLHREFSEYGRNAKEWARKCMLLLLEIDRYKVWAKKGFGSIYEYAAKLAGLSRDQVNESLRVLGRIEDKPALMEVAREKGIWAVRPVAVVATKETDEFFAEKARSMTKNEFEVYVKGVRTCYGRPGEAGQPDEADGGTNGATAGAGSQVQPAKMTVTVAMELSPEMADRLQKLKADGDYETAMKKLFEYRDEALEREKPDAAEDVSRHIPKEIERYVLECDSRMCAFPGCRRAYAHLHHTQGFARARVHDPDRIFCLCEAHHGLAHRGLIENEEMPAKFWRVRSAADPASPRFGIDQKVEECRQGQVAQV